MLLLRANGTIALSNFRQPPGQGPRQVNTALAVGSRKEVDELMEKVLKAGGTEPRQPQDYGWMYGRSFQDIDGHLWEVFYMDMSAMPKQE